MLFSSPDYPVFLIAVFFLYALARWGGPALAWARIAVMVLLADVVFVLIAKDVGALWDPIGGGLFRLALGGFSAEEAGRWGIGAAVLGGGLALGRSGAGWIASDRGQAAIARGLVAALVALAGAVLWAWRAGALDATTAAIAGHAHLAVLAVLGVGIAASRAPAHRALGRVVMLFIASSLFYQAWASAMPGAYRYLLALLLATIVLDYYLGLWIERTEGAARRKALVVISLCSNLGVLAFFKYADFFTQDVATPVLRAVGVEAKIDTLQLILPAGISFHTFQSLSYTIDVYRRQLRATRSVVQFATFVLFFPQLVAGPIVRAHDLLPQLAELPALELRAATEGLFRILVGLFKKIALADTLALALADRVFEAPERFSALEVLVGIYAYALQIYLDFSAYSDIAIGSAQVLGFTLPENFRTPYRSANLQEFWRRWHISLSTWLRDYLYITLGGNHGAPWRTYVNLIATMVLGGLWHGASWAFIVWGALHGVGLAVTRYFQRRTAGSPGAARRLLARCVAIAALGYAIHRAALTEAGAWRQLIAIWLYTTPVWAAVTAWLSREAPTRAPLASTDALTTDALTTGDAHTASSASSGRGRRPGRGARGKKKQHAKKPGRAQPAAAVSSVSVPSASSVPSVPSASSARLAPSVPSVPRPPWILRTVTAMRLAMCGAGLGLLAALAWGPTWSWLPLLAVVWLVGHAADAVELGRQRVIEGAWRGLRRALAVVLVFHYVCLAWVFFRATSFDNALAVLRQIATLELDHANLGPVVRTALLVALACHFFAAGTFAWLAKRFAALPAWGQGAVLALAMVVLRELAHTKIVPFIYFQF